ncbi:Mobile element protein [Azospirillum palustre]
MNAGGAPGARLSTRLAMPVSGDTLLRLIRAEPMAPLVRDWARPLRQAVRSAASMASASWPAPSR